MKKYINSSEIACRIYFKRPIWKREPLVSVSKFKTGSFGRINFDFNEPNENDIIQLISFRVMFLTSPEDGEEFEKEVSEYLAIGQEAIDNFSNIINDLYRSGN